jgi:hypothetical protein|tara:strand:+ start:576 stop:716 length:141 start_codon:yes stop_codon:yes gene_type:complete
LNVQEEEEALEEAIQIEIAGVVITLKIEKEEVLAEILTTEADVTLR